MSLAPDQAVRVSDRAHEGHNRTPAYVRGKRGTIEDVHGSFPNPETRAYGADGEPTQRLYLVRFEQAELWRDYDGSEGDCLLVDLFEHWLAEDA